MYKTQIIIFFVLISLLVIDISLMNLDARDESVQISIMQSKIKKLNLRMDRLISMVKENDLSSENDFEKDQSFTKIAELNLNIDLIKSVMRTMKISSTKGLSGNETRELYVFMNQLTLFMEKVVSMFKYQIISKSPKNLK